MRVLTDDDVRQLDATAATTAVRAALVACELGTAQAPDRQSMTLDGRRLLIGGGALSDGMTGVRLSGSAASNLQHVTVVWGDDGQVHDLVVGSEIGARRTGAVAAVAADALCPPGPLRVGMFGSGRNGWAQVWALTGVRDIDELAVYSPNRLHREDFARRAREELGLDAAACSRAEATAEEKDLIILCTTSSVPVIDPAWVADGAHVTSIGPKSTTAHELPPELLGRMSSFVSDAPGQLNDPVTSLAHLPGRTLGSLLVATRDLNVERATTLFLYAGLSVAEIAFARAVGDLLRS